MYEMQPLSAKNEDTTTESSETMEGAQTTNSDASLWACISSAILFISALILLVSPGLLLFLSTSPTHRPELLTPLESFLSTQLALLSFTLAITLLTTIPSRDPIARARHDAHGHPLLYPLVGSSAVAAVISYNTAPAQIGTLGLAVTLTTGVIAVWGSWVILFEGTERKSKKTGADKHTSAFLFGNKSAASVQKKEWKKKLRE